MPKRLSVASLKGGVGKSTTVMMLADSLAYHHGAQVLVVDLDAQANCGQMILSYAGLRRAEQAKRTITYWVDCLSRGVQSNFIACASVGVCGLQEVRNGSRAKSGAPLPGQVAVIPSTPHLRFTEMAFDHRYYDKTDRAAPRQAMTRFLDQGLRAFGEAYDYVIFDCPPGFTTLAQAALCVSDGIITPSLDDPVSVWSLKAFRDYGLKEELGIWRREAHRVLYTRVQEKGGASEKITLRQDVNLAGFEVFSASMKDTVEALRWAQRTAPDNYRTFREKYGPIASSVEQLASEAAQFAQAITTPRTGGVQS